MRAAAPKAQEIPALTIGTKPEALEPKMQNRGFIAALGSMAAGLGREALQLVVMPRPHDQQRRNALLVRPHRAMGELHQKKLIALPVGEFSVVPSRVKGALLRQEMVYRGKASKNGQPFVDIMVPLSAHCELWSKRAQKGSVFYAPHHDSIDLLPRLRQGPPIFPVRDRYFVPEGRSGSSHTCRDALGAFIPAALLQETVAKASRSAPVGWGRAVANMLVNGGLSQQRCFSIATGAAGRTFLALEFHSAGFNSAGIAAGMRRSATQGAFAMEKQSQDQKKVSSEPNRPYK